ncbi:hypothetical protein [Schlesneria paludicola]|uniref:hypothetical protein n=1 Tax=Schlesneria paludicola TaxID=360056 RepID=UPI00029A97C6|nr:hypothetical protein [Schlesneria paludicola]
MVHSSDGDEGDDEWQDEDDDDGYIPCPYCGQTMLEAADYCPSCDRWISSEQVSTNRRPWWVIAVALLLLGLFVLSAFRL